MELGMRMELYRECVRNHGATVGAYTTDGCTEYLHDPAELPALKCAACGCHRNFHRRYIAVHPGGGPVAGAGGNAMVAYAPPAKSAEGVTPTAVRRRRTRTKFSPLQKQKMYEFAEAIGWKVQRRRRGAAGGDEMARFCEEIGVSRQVFKVWMHNHKHTATVLSPLAPAPLRSIKMVVDSADDRNGADNDNDASPRLVL